MLIPLLLIACPSPPESGPRKGGNTPAPSAPSAPAPQKSAPSGGAGVGAGAPQRGMELARLTPLQTQDEVRAGAHVTISGDLTGSCAGALRLDVVERAKHQGPTTVLDLDGVGAFSVVVPPGGSYSINALCDSDGDGFARDREIGMPLELGEVTADVSDVALFIGITAAGAGGPAGSGAPTGSGAGAPPPSDGAAAPSGEIGPSGPPPGSMPTNGPKELPEQGENIGPPGPPPASDG